MAAHQHEHPAHPAFDPDETLSLDESHDSHPHVTPLWPMLAVFVALLFFTALTVLQARIPTTVMSEFMHVVAAILIASIKALLVAAYFMHLRYDKPMNTVVLGATLFAVVLFLGLTMLDLYSRHLADPRERGEIYPGGNAKLFAGEVDPGIGGGALANKVDASMVDHARAAGAQGKGAPAPAEGAETDGH